MFTFEHQKETMDRYAFLRIYFVIKKISTFKIVLTRIPVVHSNVEKKKQWKKIVLTILLHKGKHINKDDNFIMNSIVSYKNNMLYIREVTITLETPVQITNILGN